MDTPESIRTPDTCYALIFRQGTPMPEGITFLTGQTNPFQVGFHNRRGGVKLTPHVHRMDQPITVTEIQEFLFVTAGKIRVTIYTPAGDVVGRTDVGAGDSILLLTGGHGVEFLEDSQMFEVKQGPYPGQANAKIYINDTVAAA